MSRLKLAIDAFCERVSEFGVYICMKQCKNCNVNKNLSEYHSSKTTKDGYETECKLCRKERNKQNYLCSTKEQRFKMVKYRNVYMDYIKNSGCSLCSETSKVCYDLHHKNPKDKKYAISRIQNLSKRLIEEISKCIILCANCHRKVHNGELDVTSIPTINPISLEDFFKELGLDPL